MASFYDKSSRKTLKSKIVKSGIVVATAGAILFGVLFGGQIYNSAEEIYSNSKDRVVATLQDFKDSLKNEKIKIAKTKSSSIIKVTICDTDKSQMHTLKLFEDDNSINADKSGKNVSGTQTITFKEYNKVADSLLSQKNPEVDVAKQTGESKPKATTFKTILDTMKKVVSIKPYSIKDFCAEFYRNKILEDFTSNPNQNASLEWTDKNGVTTKGVLNSSQLISLFDVYKNNQYAFYNFGGKSFTFGKDGQIITTSKHGIVVKDDVLENYLDATNFKLGVNVLTANLNRVNPTPAITNPNNPNIMISAGINNNNNDNMRSYYNFKAGCDFPISKNTRNSVMAMVFGGQDFSENSSVVGAGLQTVVEHFSENGIFEFSGGIGYSSNSTLSGNVGASYTFPSNKNTLKVFAGIDALHNLQNFDKSVLGKLGLSIEFGGKNGKTVFLKDGFENFNNFATNYDLNRINGQLQNNGNEQGETPDKPTIIGPIDDGRGGKDTGLEQGL